MTKEAQNPPVEEFVYLKDRYGECKHSPLGQRSHGFIHSIKVQIKLQENNKWEQNACGQGTPISGEKSLQKEDTGRGILKQEVN